MCTQKPPNNWSEPLYTNYCEAVIDYLTARILPRIKEKHDEAMLTVRLLGSAAMCPPRRLQSPVCSLRPPHPSQELVRRWENHKTIIRFLSHVFKYLVRAAAHLRAPAPRARRLQPPRADDQRRASIHHLAARSAHRGTPSLGVFTLPARACRIAST